MRHLTPLWGLLMLFVTQLFAQEASCKTKVIFNMDGLLEGAPVEEIRACGQCNCPPPLTCEFCQYGINGNLCRPNGTIWCVGCNGRTTTTSPTTTLSTTATSSSGPATTPPCENDCSRCIFAGPGNSLLCTPVMEEQQLGFFNGVQDVSSDKLLAINIVSAYVLSWVDGLTALADAGGADTLVLQSLSGGLLQPTPSAFTQLNFNAAQLMSSNIVWSASLLNETSAESETAFAALLSGGLRGLWQSATNSELRSGFALPMAGQGSPLDLTTLPSLPLQEYEGLCKTNMCTGSPGGVVVPPIVIGIRT